MADPKMTSIELDPTEVALVIGEDGGSMTIRVVAATEVADGATEVPEPHEIAIALAMRLLKDPEFHDSVLDWYDSQDEEDDEDEEEEELDGRPDEPKPKA